MNRHAPRRPLWICEECDGPWPCDVARKLLGAAYPADALAAHLAALADRAARDLELPGPALLYHRFIAWTLDRNAACRACGKAGHDAIPGMPPRFVPCGKIHEVVRRDQ